MTDESGSSTTLSKVLKIALLICYAVCGVAIITLAITDLYLLAVELKGASTQNSHLIIYYHLFLSVVTIFLTAAGGLGISNKHYSSFIVTCVRNLIIIFKICDS